MEFGLVIGLIVGNLCTAGLLWFSHPERRWAAFYPLGISATVASLYLRSVSVWWSITLSALGIALFVTAFWLQRASSRR